MLPQAGGWWEHGHCTLLAVTSAPRGGLGEAELASSVVANNAERARALSVTRRPLTRCAALRRGTHCFASIGSQASMRHQRRDAGWQASAS